jgi:hypothetical protein
LDSLDRPAPIEVATPSLQANWSLSNLASMLRLNLFTHRELTQWIDNPMGTPPLIPAAEQLTLALVWLDRQRQIKSETSIKKPTAAPPTRLFSADLATGPGSPPYQGTYNQKVGPK